MDQLPKMGRPVTVLTPEVIEAERAAFKACRRRYNLSRRARDLGVGRSTLCYHLLDRNVKRAMSPSASGLLYFAMFDVKAGNLKAAITKINKAVKMLRAEAKRAQ